MNDAKSSTDQGREPFPRGAPRAIDLGGKPAGEGKMSPLHSSSDPMNAVHKRLAGWVDTLERCSERHRAYMLGRDEVVALSSDLRAILDATQEPKAKPVRGDLRHHVEAIVNVAMNAARHARTFSEEDTAAWVQAHREAEDAILALVKPGAGVPIRRPLGKDERRAWALAMLEDAHPGIQGPTDWEIERSADVLDRVLRTAPADMLEEPRGPAEKPTPRDLDHVRSGMAKVIQPLLAGWRLDVFLLGGDLDLSGLPRHEAEQVVDVLSSRELAARIAAAIVAESQKDAEA